MQFNKQLGGYYLDVQSDGGQYPWTLTGMFLGLVYSAFEVCRVVRRLNEGDQSNGSSEN